MFGITRDRVAYRPFIFGPILGSKSPGNREFFVEDLTKRTASERGGMVTFSHNLTLAVLGDNPESESLPSDSSTVAAASTSESFKSLKSRFNSHHGKRER